MDVLTDPHISGSSSVATTVPVVTTVPLQVWQQVGDTDFVQLKDGGKG